MSIRDIIEQKKQQFFLARDQDKRELQRASLEVEHKRLMQERQEAENIRRIQSDIREERAKIFQAKTEGTRRVANSIGDKIGAFGRGLSKIAEKSNNAGNKGRKNFGKGQSNNPLFNLGTSPFSTGGPAGRVENPTTKKKETKVATINVNINK